MASIVLVPGAWLGGWVWDAVTGPLRAAGHDPVPVTLPGLAERAGPASPEVDLDTHAEDLIRLLADRDLREVTLVGHSYGGFPVTLAADRAPERVARVIYLDSGAPPDGFSQLDMFEPAEQAELRAQAAAADGMLPPPPWDPAQDPDNLAGLDPAALALLRQRSTPQPFATYTQPARRTDGPTPPAALIACILPLDQVRAMIDAGVPIFAPLAGAALRELPTGHWPMLSEPDRLAELISELAAGW